jgi:hypothetical protein
MLKTVNRLELIEKVVYQIIHSQDESLLEEIEELVSPALPADIKEELSKRWAEHLKEPHLAIPYSEVKARLQEKRNSLA